MKASRKITFSLLLAFCIIFCGCLAIEPSEESTVEPEETPKEMVDILTFGKHPLSEYSIIFSSDSGYKDVALDLQSYINVATGNLLPVYSDTKEKEDGPEILVGKTNRAFSEELYSNSPELLSYELIVKGDKVQIYCGGAYSAKRCAEKLFLGIKSDDTLHYTDGSYFKENLLTESSKKTSDSDLRIMSTNILASMWSDDKTPPVVQRAEIYAAVLASYAPDVVGVQETDRKWIDIMPNVLKLLREQYDIEYSFILSEINGEQNLTSLLYRSDKYELIESDAKDYSFWTNEYRKYHIRVLAWGLFKEKSNPEHTFILINTHWPHSGEDKSWQELAPVEEAELVNNMRQKYPDIPIFCTGDFNRNPDTPQYIDFVNRSNVRSTREEAIAKGVAGVVSGGCGQLGQKRSSSNNYIDHIFGLGNFTVMRYETVLENATNWLSDHSPIYADIKLEG
jgi:endonuclease/exonuclease/phosphatase family metal-dependent hydrolase